MHPVLSIRLLGDFNVQYGEAPVTTVHTGRLRALLAYLLLHADSPHPRQHLAFQLWPDAPESNARNNLRQLLFQLRLALPDADQFLTINPHSVGWRRDDAQAVDVHRLQFALNEAHTAEQATDPPAVRRWLEEAVAQYGGELLPECYDDWIRLDRERLHDLVRTAQRKLLHLLDDSQDYEAALDIARGMLRLDPLDEEAYRQLIRLHSLVADPASARRVYEAAVDTLCRELGAEPGEALRHAFEQSQRVTLAPPPTLRPESRASRSLPLIGRRAELEQMLAIWTHVAQGASGTLLVIGEAGIGKSHLAESLYRRAQAQGHTTANARCYEAEGRLSLAPVVEWLRSPGIRPHLASLDRVWLTEIARLLPELLVEYPDLPAPESIGEYGQRQRFFEALARAVLAAPSPLLLWVDDLQWCDSKTLEWLHYLLRHPSGAALLVLGTVRGEEFSRQHPLAALTQQLRIEDKLTIIELGPLDAAETAKLAAQIGGSEVDAATAIHLFRETEGIPLFVVETVRTGLSHATDPATVAAPNGLPHPQAALPPRLYATLARRLAHLSPTARGVANLGATVGRAFSWELLSRALPDDEAQLLDGLDELWQKGILREESANIYDFTHDKLREVAYAEISVPQRRVLHRRVAQALEALNAEGLDPVSAQIAAQYDQAGLPDQALPYYQRAGLVAARLYANEDAIAWLRRALVLLQEQPATTQRDTTELALQFALARLYRITQGWAAPEVEQAVARALLLSEKVGDPVQRAEALYGAQTVYVVAAQLDKVESTYREMVQLYMQSQGRPPPLFAGMMYAGARLYLGQPIEARGLFEQMLATPDEKQALDLETSQGVNYLSHGHAWHAHVLWYLGQPIEALAHATLAVELAERFRQPFNQALAVTYQATLIEMLADFDEFQAYAARAVRLAAEYQAPYYHAWASILTAFGTAWQQPDETSVQQLRQAIARFTASGARLRRPYYLCLLARACQRANRLAEGLGVVDEAMRESRQNNERWWAPELHRLRGALLLAQGADMADVEAAYQRALELARAQHATSLALRAATSLASLWIARGQPSGVTRILAPFSALLSGPADTPDLRAARAVLQAQIRPNARSATT